jgi:hydrogenase/urease accessory protein HupE
MNEFELYFTLGRQHIADWQGIDHILFIAALCLRYQYNDWKKILVLVTAFTIGHSITLALSVLNILFIPSKWIEFFIPLTIIATAISNVLEKKSLINQKINTFYLLALFFGFIHGLGFSNYLKSLLGKNNNILLQLCSFNIGLEVGQLIIVAAILCFSYILVGLLKCNRKNYLLFASGCIFSLAIKMAIERYPF